MTETECWKAMFEGARDAANELRAELQAEREHADRLAGALRHMTAQFQHLDQLADEAITANTERRKK